MNSRSRVAVRSARCLLSAAALLFLAAACAPTQAGAASLPEQSADTVGVLADKALAPFQADLIDLAWKAAMTIPLDPHIKDRGRAQDAVAATCFELDQPKRAQGMIEQQAIGWRRGAGYADLAFYCAQHDDSADAAQYLDLANKISQTPEGDNGQDWHIERIRAKIARTHVVLGHTEQAAQFQTGVEPSESGPVEVETAKTAPLDAAAFDAQIKALDAAVTSGTFDPLRNALESCAQLFNRFYDDAARRSQLEQKILASLEKLPLQFRIDLITELADFALDHGDRAKALELVDKAQPILDSATWTMEYRIPLMARLAALRDRAGDKERARSDAAAALAAFKAGRDKTEYAFRARALRPLAETSEAIGDTAGALSTYKQVVEEGFENISPKARAEELSATCCSMALHKVEPDAELRARMLQICNGLAAK